MDFLSHFSKVDRFTWHHVIKVHTFHTHFKTTDLRWSSFHNQMSTTGKNLSNHMLIYNQKCFFFFVCLFIKRKPKSISAQKYSTKKIIVMLTGEGQLMLIANANLNMAKRLSAASVGTCQAKNRS